MPMYVCPMLFSTAGFKNHPQLTVAFVVDAQLSSALMAVRLREQVLPMTLALAYKTGPVKVASKSF